MKKLKNAILFVFVFNLLTLNSILPTLAYNDSSIDSTIENYCDSKVEKQ